MNESGGAFLSYPVRKTATLEDQAKNKTDGEVLSIGKYLNEFDIKDIVDIS